MGVQYTIQVPLTLTFTQGGAFIQFQDQWLDLYKLESIDELKILLHTLAQAAIPSDIVYPVNQESSQPQSEADSMKAQFRDIQQDNARTLDELKKQYEDSIGSITQPSGA